MNAAVLPAVAVGDVAGAHGLSCHRARLHARAGALSCCSRALICSQPVSSAARWRFSWVGAGACTANAGRRHEFSQRWLRRLSYAVRRGLPCHRGLALARICRRQPPRPRRRSPSSGCAPSRLALVAGLVSRMVLFPAGALAQCAAGRACSAPSLAGIALYFRVRRNLAAGVVGGAVLLMVRAVASALGLRSPAHGPPHAIASVLRHDLRCGRSAAPADGPAARGAARRSAARRPARGAPARRR